MSSFSAEHPACACAALLLCGASMLGGCAVGPNYKCPAINSPTPFRGEGESANRSSSELAWWQVYEDVALQTLSCLPGLQTGEGPRAVGESATRSLVTSILLIILADTIIASVAYALRK